MVWPWPWHYTCTTAKELFCAKCVIQTTIRLTHTLLCNSDWLLAVWKWKKTAIIRPNLKFHNYSLQILLCKLLLKLCDGNCPLQLSLFLLGYGPLPPWLNMLLRKWILVLFLYTLWILYFLESRAGHQIFKVKCISIAHVKITAVDQSAVKESLALFYSGLNFKHFTQLTSFTLIHCQSVF